MGNSTSKPQQYQLTHSSSLPHPLVSSPPHHQHQQPATYSNAPPSAPFVNDDPLSPPPASAKSFSAMGYGPAPTHSSIWFPAPENGLTSDARRYRDEVLAEIRRGEERERLSKRGWLGGIDGKGARPEGQTMGKRMSVGKWKDGMVGSVMERGRSWRGSLRRGELVGGGGGSKRSKRGSGDVDEAAERRRRDMVAVEVLEAAIRAEHLKRVPEGLRPGNGNDATTSPTKLRRPHPEALTPSTTFSMNRSHRIPSPSHSRTSPRPHPHLSSLPPAFVHHPSSLLPGLPTPQHLATPFNAVVSLNTPCSETMDSPFLPPLSPALEHQEVVEDEDPNDRSALSPTRLAMLLHPLSLRPGGSAASSRTNSVAPASARDVSCAGGREVGAAGGWFAGRRGEMDGEGGNESTNRTSTLSLSLSVSEQARLSLPPPPSPLADGILGGVAVRRVEAPLYSPLTEDGPPSPDNLDPSPSPPTQLPSPVIPPPPHPTPVVFQGLALLAAEVEVGRPSLISESSFTGTNFPPPSLSRASVSASLYHLPPNISISIQCDALIRELTSPDRIPLPSSPLITPSTSLATALAASQIYAAPHLPSPILPNSIFPPPPTSPLARQRVLQSTLDEELQEGVGDVSFQTPPLVQRVSSTTSDDSATSASSTLQDSSRPPTTSSESIPLPPPPPTFKRPSKSKHRVNNNDHPPRTRSFLLLAVKGRLSSPSTPPLDTPQSSQDTLSLDPPVSSSGILGRSKGSIRRSSRFLSSKLGSPSLENAFIQQRDEREAGIPVGTGAGFGGVGVGGGGSGRGSGGSKRGSTMTMNKRVSGGDWGFLMNAAKQGGEEKSGKGGGGRGKKAVEGRILKWRRESSLFE